MANAQVYQSIVEAGLTQTAPGDVFQSIVEVGLNYTGHGVVYQAIIEVGILDAVPFPVLPPPPFELGRCWGWKACCSFGSKSERIN